MGLWHGFTRAYCILIAWCYAVPVALTPTPAEAFWLPWGGDVGDALLLGAIASIFDSFSSGKRIKQVADIAKSSPEQIATLNKRNILLPYSSPRRV